MIKCPKCECEHTKDEWNNATSDMYEQFVPMEDVEFDGKAAFVCPSCKEEVDDCDIIMVPAVTTTITSVRSHEQCPECRIPFVSTDVEVEHTTQFDAGNGEVIMNVTITMVHCPKCQYSDYKVIDMN